MDNLAQELPPSPCLSVDVLRRLYQPLVLGPCSSAVVVASSHLGEFSFLSKDGGLTSRIQLKCALQV